VKHLLGREGRAQVSRFVASRPLVALDYDGTLAPIVSDPDRALMSARTESLLREVSRRFPCAIVSGREAAGLRPLLSRVAVARVVGNHGVRGRFSQLVSSWSRSVEASLGGEPGLLLEHKRASLSIHYRAARDRRRARERVMAAVATLEEARLVRGKLVVNVLPARGGHKGEAVSRLRAQLGRRSVIFIGDDVTDEDVFALDADWLLAARVGRSARSRARWFLRSQREVDALLELLLSCR
jgi:trehalose 6-phosphate phosphatase